MHQSLPVIAPHVLLPGLDLTVSIDNADAPSIAALRSALRSAATPSGTSRRILLAVVPKSPSKLAAADTVAGYAVGPDDLHSGWCAVATSTENGLLNNSSQSVV